MPFVTWKKDTPCSGCGELCWRPKHGGALLCRACRRERREQRERPAAPRRPRQARPAKRRQCPRCGGPLAKYRNLCDTCRDERQREVNRSCEKKRRKENNPAKTARCVGCGKLCWHYRTAEEPGHLCLDCRRKRSMANCIYCGKEFKKHPGRRTEPAQKYCSATCQYADCQRVRRERYGTPKLTCAYCGGEFYRIGGKKATTGVRYCSQACHRRAKLDAKWLKWDGRITELDWHQCECGRWLCRPGVEACKPCESDARKARARAKVKLRHQKETNGLVPELVFERDGWRCGLCHKKVDHRLRYPHPKSASVDHIVPLSQGGTHTYANVHCAHLRCNLIKHNRGGGEQLALLGIIEEVPAPPRAPRTKKKGARICTEDGCDRPHLGRGLCKTHYHREYAKRRNNATA